MKRAKTIQNKMCKDCGHFMGNVPYESCDRCKSYEPQTSLHQYGAYRKMVHVR